MSKTKTKTTSKTAKKTAPAPVLPLKDTIYIENGTVEVERWTESWRIKTNTPRVSIEVDDGSSDGRPWGCSGIVTVETSDPNILRTLAASLLDAADWVEEINAENAAKIKTRLATRNATRKIVKTKKTKATR